MSTPERRTWQEWNDALGAGIRDPDGFRTDQSEDGLYTEDEFYKRWAYCTIDTRLIDVGGPLGHWTRVFGPAREVRES
jgi:hypothetical protein